MAAYEKTYHGFDAIKWTADGATTIAEVAERLEALASHYRDMAATGKIELEHPVDNGHICIVTTDPDVAEKYGLEEPDDDEEGEDDEFEEGDEEFDDELDGDFDDEEEEGEEELGGECGGPRVDR